MLKSHSNYSCYGLKKFMGKEFMGIARSTASEPDGTMEKVYRLRQTKISRSGDFSRPLA